MNRIIRLTTCINKVNCANPADCLEEIKQMFAHPGIAGSDITVFPQLALCSPSCGNLFSGTLLAQQCADALDALAKETLELRSYIIVGLALNDWGQAVSAMAVLYQGEIIALVPTVDNPPPFVTDGFSENLLPVNSVFACGELRFCIVSCQLESLALRCAGAAGTGCDLIIVPAYSPVYAGMIDKVCECAAAVSASIGCAIAIVNGGVGDTSHPYVYNGFSAIYECGQCLNKTVAAFESCASSVDLDTDIISSNKKISAYTKPFHSMRPMDIKPKLLRPVSKNPFLPAKNPERYLEELFLLQVRALVARMENIGVNKLVVGVSGGLDSTAAMLVCAMAVDILGLPRKNIIGITMPGFGTSDRTYYNALSLLEQLEVTQRDISIKNSVLQHLEDISHTGKKDVTYENAQARERTQILLDIANTVSGIVVGSGDLSEEALGFCTFAGDHIANYNVNNCITKTTLRQLIFLIAEQKLVANVQDILLDILDTPISPELLPPSAQGEITQKTEDILGPYALHDFFLYYLVRYRFRPYKLYHYACIAFATEIEPAFIREKLVLFIKRFCAGQFKRSCAPDSASITEVNLCGVKYFIPSDLDPTALLSDLDNIEF